MVGNHGGPKAEYSACLTYGHVTAAEQLPRLCLEATPKRTHQNAYKALTTFF